MPLDQEKWAFILLLGFEPIGEKDTKTMTEVIWGRFYRISIPECFKETPKQSGQGAADHDPLKTANCELCQKSGRYPGDRDWRTLHSDQPWEEICDRFICRPCLYNAIRNGLDLGEMLRP